MIASYRKFSSLSQFAIAPLANLAARFYIGWEFLKSGLLKLDDWEETLEMFTDDWALPFMSPEISAYMATAGELLLPIMLFIGLFTRLGALGLFVMALVIELFIYPGTQQHYYWMIILTVLVGQGGHKISLDNYLCKAQTY